MTISLSELCAMSMMGACLVVGAGCGDASSSATAVDAGANDSAARDSSTAPVDAGADVVDESTPAPVVSCAEYCTAVTASCAGDHAQYLSGAECTRLCANMAVGVFGDSDDTLGCRLSYALSAAHDPATSCAAAGPFGGGACGDRCDDYCTGMLQLCGGGSAPYSNKTVCWNDCTQHFAFDMSSTEYMDVGDTLNCREGWLLRAGDPDAGAGTSDDCAAAGPASSACR